MRKKLEEKRQQREAIIGGAVGAVAVQPPPEQGGGKRTPETPRKQWGEGNAKPVLAQQGDATGVGYEGKVCVVYAL